MGVKVRQKVKGSGVYWVFINHHGKRVSRQVGSKSAAQKVAKQIQAKLTLGEDAFPKAKPKLPTLKEYYEHIKRTYLQTATRRTTQRLYRINFDKHINPQLGAKPIDEITKADVRDLIASLVEKGLAKGTVRQKISHLSAVLNHAVDDETILRNPAAKCTKYYKQAPARNKEIQPLNAEEVGLLLRTTLEHSPGFYVLFLCAIHTGMRASELAGLQWDDIDFNGKFLTVR